MSWKQIDEARRRLGREQGFVVKGWGGRIPIALVYPNSYYLGMSSLGFQTVYRLFNAHDSVVCERGFYSGATTEVPGADTEGWSGSGQAGRRTEPPRREQTLSLESQRSLADFAVVAFSVSFEMDYFNMTGALRQAGIPLRSSERDERHPLVIAGGPCITANPEPMAAFLDAVVMGEGEVIVPELVRVLDETRGDGREAVLQRLATVPGIHVPALGNPVSRQWLTDMDSHKTASVILTPDTSLGDMYLMEVSRGCAWGCRFCLAGYLYRPMRPRSLPVLTEMASEGLRHRRKLGLVGAAVSDYPWIDELVDRLRGMGASLSASSLRLRPLSRRLVEALLETGANTLTFAPEAGSERLREIIRKGVSENEVFDGVRLAAEYHVKRLKFYFMVGLPGEGDEDINALIDLCLASRSILDSASPSTEIVANLTPFVPKAGTPFQWEAMTPAAEVMERIDRIRRGLRRGHVKVRFESPDWSAVQGVLARGDRRLADVLASVEKADLVSWQTALEQSGLDAQEFLGARPLEGDLPWCSVDTALPKGLLERQRSQAMAVKQRGAGSEEQELTNVEQGTRKKGQGRKRAPNVATGRKRPGYLQTLLKRESRSC